MTDHKEDQQAAETLADNRNDKKESASDSTEKNPVTSNSPEKKRMPSEKIDVEFSDRPSPSTSGPKGTEEPGTDKGPGGTGW